MKTLLHLAKIIILIALGATLLSCKSATDSMPSYLLKAAAEPMEAGTVTPAQGAYEQGENIQLTATPHQHWVFVRWEGDFNGTENPTSITMDGDKDISALFIKREYPLAIEIEGEGSVAETVVQQKATDYEGGTLVELTASAVEGWHFSRWEGDLEGNENPATIEIDREKTIIAIFEKIGYALTIEVVGEGSVTEEVVQAKTTDYPYQTVVELTAAPSEGWEFSHWEGETAGTENPVQITIENDMEITAVFVRQVFTITITYDGPGTTHINLISGNQSEEGFEYESVVSIGVQPMSGWEFLGWQGDLTGTENPIEVTITEDITAHAILEQVPFDGEGTVSNPYQIATLEQLNAIRGRFLNNHFVQIANIDASETETWNNGEGFMPIGLYSGNEFKGSYNGGGFKIEALTIDLNPAYYFDFISIGLFGRIKGGQIKNLNLENAKITGSDNAMGVGAVAGLATTGSRFENVHISGKVTGTNYVGGIVGILEMSEIYSSSVNVTLEGNSEIGGMVGASNEGKVIGSRASGVVTGNQNIGGLIGAQREGKMVKSSSSEVIVTGNKNVGGLIGASTNTKEAVLYSYATGQVFGAENVGGLIGFFSGFASIGESYATGNVSSNEGVSIGGLIGVLALDSRLYKSYALGSASGTSVVGGLVGRNAGQIIESYSAGPVSASQQYGGLVGANQGVLKNSYWDMETSGQTDPVWDPYQGVTSATGLTTSQMTGTNAQSNMPDFDWSITWNTSQGYPMLKALPASNSIIL